MNKEIINLFQKYINGEANQHELKQVLQILEAGLYQEEWDALLTKDIDSVLKAEFNINSITDTKALALHSKILNSIDASPVTTVVQKPKRLTLWPRIAVAASLILIASVGSYYFLAQFFDNSSPSITYQNDVTPGKFGATLTLANGKKILIKDALAGDIAKESGVQIYKNASGQVIYKILDEKVAASGINTLSTTRGEQMQVILPDGSLVFLNAESSLKYPTSFVKKTHREVSLVGEGYFEVAKDKAHPFIVKTAQQDVEVLGTHFNINSYANEPNIKTTLLEGSVQVSSGQESKILTPGNQAINTNGNIHLHPVDTELAVAWKNNNFVFDVLDIEQIMRMLERWYDVEIIYTDGIPKGTFWGSVSRFDNISKVLISLEATGKAHFEIKGKKVYVSQ
ncbi:FecR family protein [Pedobacter sp. MW01-1-1]|uniref:FecR family protein n=1 Tax=Pedobacter sp. MW01-1-1 TaxID=3383027 RepID=UPI003FEEDA60